MKKIATLSLFFLLLLSTALAAQVPDDVRQRRRQFVEGLLQTILESQKDRNIAPARPGRPNLSPPELRPGYGGGNAPVSPKMVRCRKQFEVWENRCGELIVELRKEESRVPKFRPLLADAIQVLARVKNLRGHANRIPNVQPLVNPYCELDADWRLLGHRLKNVRGLPKKCTTCIENCQACNTQLCEIFEVQPQIKRRELLRYCSEMSSYFQHLTQDVYYDFNGKPNGEKLVRRCQGIYARINEAVPMIHNGDYDTIVRTYRSCADDWQKLKVQLIKSPYERVRRHCHSIEECGRHVNELLLLDPVVDYQYLSTITNTMKSNIDHIFSLITLQDLLEMEQPGKVFLCAREFQRQTDTFNNCLLDNSPHQQRQQEYALFVEKWQALRVYIGACKTAEIQRRLVECDANMNSFNGVFDDGPVFDHQSMVQICAELDQLCLRLDRQIQRRINRSYDQRFQKDICTHVESLQTSIHELHEHAIANRRHEKHARNDLKKIMRHWGKLRPLFAKCKEADRRVLNQLRSQIEPLLVKLQFVFSDV